MSDLTPEKLAELQRLLDAGTPVPWAQGDPAFGGRNAQCVVSICSEAMGRDVMGPMLRPALFDVELIAAAVSTLPALLDAAAERDRLAESVRAYGQTIDRWGLLIIAATHSEDITTPDGDGDWGVIESRLAEVPALLAERDALAAKLDAVRAELAAIADESLYGGWDSPFVRSLVGRILRALDATPTTPNPPQDAQKRP